MNTVPNIPASGNDPAAGQDYAALQHQAAGQSPTAGNDPAFIQGPAATGGPATKRRWRNRAIAAATGTVLLGAAVFGATAASAASSSQSPSAGTALAGTPSSSGSVMAASTSTSSPTSSASPSAGTTAKHPGKHPFVRVLRQELRIDIQGKPGFGDNAHEVAYLLIHHKTGFGKLPANLQADLKTLEGAAAADRDADAGKIKGTALNGGYGDQIQKLAKAVQANLAKAPTAPATPKS